MRMQYCNCPREQMPAKAHVPKKVPCKVHYSGRRCENGNSCQYEHGELPPANSICKEIVLTAHALSHTLEPHNLKPETETETKRRCVAPLLRGANAPLVRDATFYILLR